jgi:HEAT repeat protein
MKRVSLALLVALVAVGQAGEPAIDEFSRLVCECRGEERVPDKTRERIDALIAGFVVQGTAADAAVPHLVAALDLFYDRNPRDEAASAIGKVCAKPVEVFPALIVLGYEGPGYSRVRLNEHGLIHRAGHELPDEVILALLPHDDWRVRCWAVAQVGERIVEKERAASSSTSERMRKLTWTGKDLKRRDEALRKIHEDALIQAAGHLTVALTPLLTDPDPDVRAFAVASLGGSWLAHRALFPSVLALFTDDSPLRYRRDFWSGYDPVVGDTVRKAALHAASALKPHPEASTALLAGAANHSDTIIRVACLEALRGHRHQSAWRPVIEGALQDEDDRVFHAAIGHVGRLEASPEMIATLTAALSQDSRVPATAAALSRLGKASRPAVDALSALLQMGRYEHNLLYCLGAIGPDAQSALPAIRQCLNSSSPGTRVAAARAIWRVSQDADAALLVYLELLPDRQARQSVCAALGEMKSAAARAVPALLESLGTDVVSDIQIMNALGEIGPAAEPALPALDARATDPRTYIAARAKAAAKRIRGE